ncbi:hypothetical protein [Bacillus ndiopicus]|uniref:hypothetical protein n=1 Tax=Bacillus ndiopicus TaxID=1347368 RepID=UPI0005A75781|nr:hypothetical protein [Bacillus ndiopicus]
MKRSVSSLFTSNFFMVGTAFGASLLLVRWITGNPLMSSEKTLIKYGLFFGIIYTLSYGLALTALAFFVKKAEFGQPATVYITERIDQQTTGHNQLFFKSITYFAQYELWIVQFVVLYTFTHLIFNEWYLQFLFAFLLLLVIFAFYTSTNGFYLFTMLFIITLFSTLTFIPIYYFVLNGTTKIYEGIRLYHPYLLYYKNPEIITVFIAYLFVAAGQVLVDFPTWFNLSFIKQEKRKSALFSAAFIKILLGFSFTAILMIAIFRGSFENLEVLILTFLYREESLWLSYLFGLFSVIACFVVLLNSLKAFQAARRENIAHTATTLISLFLVVGLLSGIEKISLLYTVLFFGIMNAVLLPFIYVLLFTKIRMPNYTFVIAFLLIVGSEIYLFQTGQLLIPVIVSISLATGFLLWVRQRQVAGDNA